MLYELLPPDCTPVIASAGLGLVCYLTGSHCASRIPHPRGECLCLDELIPALMSIDHWVPRRSVRFHCQSPDLNLVQWHLWHGPLPPLSTLLVGQRQHCKLDSWTSALTHHVGFCNTCDNQGWDSALPWKIGLF